MRLDLCMERAQIDSGLQPNYRLGELGLGDREQMCAVASWAYALKPGSPELRALGATLELEQSMGVWLRPPDADKTRGGEILVAGHASIEFPEFRVPGGRVPASGLAWMSVHPGHRRRGIGSSMVKAHLNRAQSGGCKLSALFSSEPAIYGRFGYGVGAHGAEVTLRHGAPMREVAGVDGLSLSFEPADDSRLPDLICEILEAEVRPGSAIRTPVQTRAMLHRANIAEPESEPSRVAIVRDRRGAARAYAVFSRRARVDAWGNQNGVVRVGEVGALDSAASRTLWAGLAGMDLMSCVETGILPVDDPLFFYLEDSRIARPRMRENVWIRIVDIVGALTARSYTREVDIAVEVTDELIPENQGIWRLRGGRHVSDLARTTARPDISLNVRELSAAYLGGASLASLGRAGFVREHTRGALDVASLAFGWPIAPFFSWRF